MTSLLTRASLVLAQRLSIAATGHTSMEGAFSRNRSLRRTAKKRALQEELRAASGELNLQ